MLKKNMNTIQLNKFSKFHDGEKVFFCHAGYLEQTLNHVKSFDHDVILISGNSDWEVTYERFYPLLPPNVKYWFAQNCLVTDKRVIPIPIGIENQFPSSRGETHGVGYNNKKEIILSNLPIKPPSKFIYSNFRVNTNPSHRSLVRKICIKSPHIDWEEPNLTTEQFFTKASEYECVVCAQGNGNGDNHRIYETLYMGRIPITFNKTMHQKLHFNFPVILLEDPEMLRDIDYIKSRIYEVKSFNYDTEMLKCSWWENLIKSKIELL